MCATRWGRVGWATGLTAAMLGGGLTAGCHGSTEQPQPAGSAAPSAARSVASARYTGLKSVCPTLTSDVAKGFGASGEGHPAGVASSVPGVVDVRCGWRPAGVRPSVDVTVSIYPNGFAPTGTGDGNARHLYDGLRDDAGRADSASTSTLTRSSQWGPAFVTANASLDSVAQTTVTGNAVITVVVYDQDRLTDNMSVERDDLLRRLGPAVHTLTGEVVDNLR